MVTQWGFAGDKLGMTAWEDSNGGPMGRTAVSEEKEIAIDKAVQELCDEAFKTTMETLKANRELLDKLVESLLEKETVDGFELNKLVLEVTGKPPATAFNPMQVPVEGNVVPTAAGVPADAQ
jgi:cell division protease FtsH